MPANCTKCAASLPEKWFHHSGSGRCVNCGAFYEVRGFPALATGAGRVVASELTAAEGEASCYQHEAKRAVAACGRCGRFLCSLCEMEFAGTVWCPQCVVAGISRSDVAVLETSRTLYDSIALGATALPLVLLTLALFTGPAGLFLTLRYWRRPSSLIPRSKWRLWVALVLGVLETAGLIAAVVLLIWAARQRVTSAS